jgi:hypothetical protein
MMFFESMDVVIQHQGGCHNKEQMEMGKEGLLEEDHLMMEINLGGMETISGEKEEYLLVAIRAAWEAAILTRQQNQRTQEDLTEDGH